MSRRLRHLHRVDGINRSARKRADRVEASRERNRDRGIGRAKIEQLRGQYLREGGAA